jgi:hypothetical protein
MPEKIKNLRNKLLVHIYIFMTNTECSFFQEIIIFKTMGIF